MIRRKINIACLQETKQITKIGDIIMLIKLVMEKPVVILSKSGCCFCHTIKILIHGFGASLAVYELDELPNGRQLERELLSLGCRPSVPAVFIGGELVGGSNEVMSLHIRGKLVQLLKKAKAIFI
ncbi:monothiol glutaredoxin-S2-like [Camellia sinensis]|uniref:monothiol glutaredoxin-S2-like n=1 Tax=Camellia sinensis TaxID=4442 RepID=UPI0010363B02|nr:monothiol glutaredoxin-S2-like [Camellia sinensis]